jgi:hypothetical protein
VKLTRDQRTKLFAGEPVTITFPGDSPCPYPIGHIEVLSANVKLEVTEIRRTKPTPEDPEGRHSLGYTLHNQRLGDRYMAKQSGQAHPEQYVSSPAGGIDLEAGAAVDELTQRRITREAKAKAQRDVAEHLSVLEKLELVLTAQMQGRNLTTQGEMKQARAQIKRAKRKIEGQAKALEAKDDEAA